MSKSISDILGSVYERDHVTVDRGLAEGTAKAGHNLKATIADLERQMREQGDLDHAGMEAMERDIMTTLEAAIAFAEASPFPTPEQAAEDAFAA